MDTGIITPTGIVEYMPLFQIGPYLTGVVREAVKKDPIMNSKYVFMKEKIRRFDTDVMFALTDLGYKIIAPFAKSRDNVLFSNGGTLFIASKNYVMGRYFNPELLKDSDGIQVPTDETIGYDIDLKDFADYKEGIIDNRGYVDSTYLDNVTNKTPGKSSNDLLASFLLMNDMLFSERIYKDVIANRKKQTDLEYLTSQPNCICIKRDGEKFNLSYVSENSGKVDFFIKELEKYGLIAKYDMLPTPPTDLTVQEENDLMVEPEIPALKVK